MALTLDFSGIGENSLKISALSMNGLVGLVGVALMVANAAVLAFNRYFFLDVLIERMFVPWYAVVNWTVLFICVCWGYIAISLPCRPREPKSRALALFAFFLALHAVSHMMWIVLFLKRCHNFFLNSLAGNLVREGVEAVSDKLADKEWVQNVLYVAVPVLNWVSAPFMYTVFRDQFPPLHLGFLCGWNWAVAGFAFGVLPVMLDFVALAVVLGYKNAIDCGGDGNEKVAPSKLAFFYSLPYKDRADIRSGATQLEDYESDPDEESYESSGYTSSSPVEESEEGSGGTKDSYSGSEQRVRRIPSYKPNRTMVV